MPFLPTAIRPPLYVPPVPVRVPTTPDVEIVRGGVTPPVPVSPPPVSPPIVTVTEMPPAMQPVIDRPFVQPTPVTPVTPAKPVVPVYPRKQARH